MSIRIGRVAAMALQVVGCVEVAGSDLPSERRIFPASPAPVDLFNVKIFEEVLLPVGRPDPADTEALARALEAYVGQGDLAALSGLEALADQRPGSAWNLSLLVDVGLMHRHVGRTSAAIRAWERAWELGRKVQEGPAGLIALRALGELLEVHAGLGHPDRLRALLKEAQARDLQGVVTEKAAAAREALHRMEREPGEAFRCGPVALAHLLAAREPRAFLNPVLMEATSTEQGTTLAQNNTWAARLGLGMQMAKAGKGAAYPVPSVVHFRLGHFAALMAHRQGRYLVHDPFLGDAWITQAVLEEEASGYALVPGGKLPAGWQGVALAEAGTVAGKGAWGPGRPDDTRPDSRKVGGRLPATVGVPVHAFHANVVSLNLDLLAAAPTPVLGPRVDFHVTYNQREYGQAQVFDYCNLGPKWTFSFLACLKDDTTNPMASVSVCHPGGGGLVFQSLGDGTYRRDGATLATLTKAGNAAYVIRYPDGRAEHYDLADRAWGLRRVVLTRVEDRYGRQVRLSWDPTLRLVAVTDAAGGKTTVAYESADPLRITRVTAPGGEATLFAYDASGQLCRIEGPGGKASTVEYGPSSDARREPRDFVRRLVTPEGEFRFESGEDAQGAGFQRYVQVFHPDGHRERVEGGPGYAYAIPPEKLPQVPELDPDYHPLLTNFRETFHWDRLPAGGRLDHAQATNLQWGHGPGGFSSGLVLSERKPGTPRHWYVHAGAFWGGLHPAAVDAAHPLTLEGALRPGAKLLGVTGTREDQGRLAPVHDGDLDLVTRDFWMEQGRVQARRRAFDLRGRLLSVSAPGGEDVTLAWDPARGDLQSILRGSAQERFTYDASHRPLSWSVGADRLSFTYLPDGRLASCQVGEGIPCQFAYGDDGRLTSVTQGTKAWQVEATGALKPLPPLPMRQVSSWAEVAFADLFSGANGALVRQIVLGIQAR